MNENEIKTNWDTLNKEIEECPYDLDDEGAEKLQRTKTKMQYTEILLKMKQNVIGIT